MNTLLLNGNLYLDTDAYTNNEEDMAKIIAEAEKLLEKFGFTFVTHTAELKDENNNTLAEYET